MEMIVFWDAWEGSNMIVNALAMWGLLQVLLLWFLFRAGEQRELARRRYIAHRLQVHDWIEIESLADSEDQPGHAAHRAAAARPPGTRPASSTTLLGKLP
jgi:hypothetical protein